jgi:hypothetical protein
MKCFAIEKELSQYNHPLLNINTWSQAPPIGIEVFAVLPDKATIHHVRQVF